MNRLSIACAVALCASIAPLSFGAIDTSGSSNVSITVTPVGAKFDVDVVFNSISNFGFASIKTTASDQIGTVTLRNQSGVQLLLVEIRGTTVPNDPSSIDAILVGSDPGDNDGVIVVSSLRCSGDVGQIGVNRLLTTDISGDLHWSC